MKQLLLMSFVILAIAISGCANGNLSPKFSQQLDNQNGKIGDIESVQNGIKADLNGIKQQAEIQNSKIDKVQSGLFNLQNNNAVNGIQILSGPGGLIVGTIGMVILGFVVLSYRKKAIENGKTADMLAEHIVKNDNPELEAQVFTAAMHSDVKKNVYDIIKKHKQG